MLWGKGFEVDRAGSLPWLREVAVDYWGDLDTHGFAILDRLRAWLPQTRSFLMDRETLLAHRERWGREPTPDRGPAGPTDRRRGRALRRPGRRPSRGTGLRLEQERIDWAWVGDHLPYDVAPGG